MVPIWQAMEVWQGSNNLPPPYWAFCWPGGQAIARYLLDNPELVRGKSVVDFAAGSAVSAMAAAREKTSAAEKSRLASAMTATVSLPAGPLPRRTGGFSARGFPGASAMGKKTNS